MDLQSEGHIGDVAVPNRAVFRPVRTRLTDEAGAPAPELADHLAARAAGGAGLVAGPAQMLVHPSASGPSYIDAYDDDVVEPLTAATRAVHDEGGRIFGQLTHTGAEETGDWEMQAQVAPSASPSNAANEMPKPMDHAEIAEIQDGFATAAVNLEAAGFDGVELNAGPYSVLRQFLSPRYNTRVDEYGGDWSARARFVTETLDTVGGAVDSPVGLHLSLAELEYGGYEFGDVPDLLGALSGFDYLSCTVGTPATYGQTHAGVGTDAVDLREHVATVAETVDVPVVGRQPFTTVDDATDLLGAGADFVSFSRQLLADEQTIDRAAADEPYTRCIQCNQKCLEGVYGHAHGGQVACVVDPRTGRESDLPRRENAEPAAIEAEILVVGGGAAGLRFGAVAAQRGHDVTLREATADLGGQLQVAAQGPLAPLARAREDLVADAERAGVEIQRESPVSADSIEAHWDVVVVATGANRPDPEAHGFEGEVLGALDVLEGADVGADVLLFDQNRWVITMQTGLELADRAEAVEMVSSDHYPGFRTEQPILPNFVAALQAAGATFTGNHTVDAVDADGTVHLRSTLTGDRTTREPDTVVVAGRRTADESLYRALDERRDDVYRVGDAVSPRKLDRAYYDGELLARRL
jgi:2,4-dienoyl-CoA reductase-like NADH-dependent reductase (Old Yellow Enzyme family)/thioredoxin reductase